AGIGAGTTVPAATGAPAAAGTESTVQSGDSLSKIAQRHLGDANRWPEIYQANRAVIGDNPDLIKPGQRLRIPGGGTPPQTA
ncbi:MAG TPA: LysM peptidoglycan-binding domain-containing protein, partial [Thermoanaerobaculia bacterium]|nr:LysM peptidoglycan-binding domain-containing protein [Thermoanaerobaculia bacterium]